MQILQALPPGARCASRSVPARMLCGSHVSQLPVACTSCSRVVLALECRAVFAESCCTLLARLFEHVAVNEALYKADEAQLETAQPAAGSSGEADMTDAEAVMEAGCVRDPNSRWLTVSCSIMTTALPGP